MSVVLLNCQNFVIIRPNYFGYGNCRTEPISIGLLSLDGTLCYPSNQSLLNYVKCFLKISLAWIQHRNQKIKRFFFVHMFFILFMAPCLKSARCGELSFWSLTLTMSGTSVLSGGDSARSSSSYSVWSDSWSSSVSAIRRAADLPASTSRWNRWASRPPKFLRFL